MKMLGDAVDRTRRRWSVFATTLIGSMRERIAQLCHRSIVSSAHPRDPPSTRFSEEADTFSCTISDGKGGAGTATATVTKLGRLSDEEFDRLAFGRSPKRAERCRIRQFRLLG
jgi:hypothetical protein